MPAADSTTATETVFRIEFPRIVAALARTVGDLGLAEELAQDALEAALRQWPVDGTPSNPGAWLMTVAKRRAVDRLRRDRTAVAKYALAAAGQDEADPDHGSDDRLDALDPDHIGDDRLRLIFVACHPVLTLPARTALTLRLVGGLTTAEIARAYLVPEATVAQRIVRAKRTIAEAGVPFEVPVGADRAARLAAVLEVVYLIFNEGYSATSGEDWMRIDLCAEALRLSRVLAYLDPDDAEVLGLQALLEIQSSRLAARLGANGEPVLLMDQDRRRWDQLLIRRGLDCLAAADRLSAGSPPGPYELQAAIAACHARAVRADDTDWERIATLYGVLAATAPSPIVELNRAVAASMAWGPAAGLDLVDQLVALGLLDGYHLLHSVRGDLLSRLDRHAEAATAFDRAAALAGNDAERRLSLDRAAAAAAAVDPPSVPASPTPDIRGE